MKNICKFTIFNLQSSIKSEELKMMNEELKVNNLK